jgi:hypothetical protein
VKALPVRVVEITPVLVVEITPVLVVEITPVLVVEITPLFASAGADTARTNMADHTTDLRFFIVLLLVDLDVGNLVGSKIRLLSISLADLSNN